MIERGEVESVTRRKLCHQIQQSHTAVPSSALCLPWTSEPLWVSVSGSEWVREMEIAKVSAQGPFLQHLALPVQFPLA